MLTREGKRKSILVEAKAKLDSNRCWRECATFFERDGQDDAYRLFASFYQFQDDPPARSVPVKKGKNAFESCTYIKKGTWLI